MNGFPGLRRGLITLVTISLIGLPGTAGAAQPARTAAPDQRQAVQHSDTAPQLQRRLDAAHQAGMPGIQAAFRRGERSRAAAAGVADTRTERPLRAGFHHRVGSVTKTFVATAVLQQVEAGRVELDAPVGRYLPRLVPGERGRRITVRMLLNHTSGIADYADVLFASTTRGSLADLDENRFRHHSPAELVATGLDQPATNAPGASWSYSNTNYVIAGELLREVTGQSPRHYVTREIIHPLGLRNTYFPGSTPFVLGPHSKAYEALYQLPERRGEYSVYDMSWARSAGALISTPAELNRFYRALFRGKLLSEDGLAEMRRTVPVPGSTGMRYGLGLMRFDAGSCGTLWGHEGKVWGMSTLSLHSTDGSRQLSYGMNLTDYQRLDESGSPIPHPIDRRIQELQNDVLCGAGGSGSGPSRTPERHADRGLALVGTP
ncbi:MULTISPECIES: serine hydrolase domain-containing protein [unclassified Actinopolyspora]|uniref:serine hydrolase domain-containing protein n=1 Tax=unclassified Actinopolyspora TaxID=2639451 RepID=UPI0013F60399|nr:MULTISPECIES: serine hydrolase domain-containing protein [unclassified Actinopolyspora]NHD17567.1 beta-lactamase family protein [Actinopolyspora sp. BKK2]NHE76700.1 beta-lactamase family protein [Actinopolyspora sp. BKK1]